MLVLSWTKRGRCGWPGPSSSSLTPGAERSGTISGNSRGGRWDANATEHTYDRPDLAISGLCANARAHTAVEVDWRSEAWRANLCWKGRLREVSHPRRPWRRHWTRSERRWRPKGQGLLARVASHSGSFDSSRLHASRLGHQRRTTFGGSALK